MSTDDHLLPRQRDRTPYDVFASAVAVRAAYVGADGYGLAYGSHADGSARTSSDLDLLFVSHEVLSPERLQALTRDVIRLHQRHGLGLDQEVSYASKLCATAVQVQEAVSLGGFPRTADGGVTVDTVVAASWFLDSRDFKLRLILNALTVPHVFLGGDAGLYHQHRERGERSVALLALSLVDGREFTAHDALQALTGDPEGACGEDFLGYDEGPRRSPALFSSLQRGLSALVAEGVIGTRDGVNMRQDSVQRRRLLQALGGVPSADA